MHYSDIRVDTLALGGHRTIVERATANGGISGFYNEKLVWIRVTLRPDSVAFATGLYGDAKGLSELLGIASTITLR
jgi:hypothetical protein